MPCKKSANFLTKISQSSFEKSRIVLLFADVQGRHVGSPDDQDHYLARETSYEGQMQLLNVWELREIMVKSRRLKQGGNFWRIQLGSWHMSTNTGRKEQFLSNNAGLKFHVSSFNTTPKKDYIQMVAHKLMRS